MRLALPSPRQPLWGQVIYAALAYFRAHHDTIVAAIEAENTLAERARGSEPFSRDELLRRRAVTNDRRA